jgi:DNA-binding beta-propeller fold protein YncE
MFGVGTDGAVVRFAPSGNWVFHPPQPARVVFPQPGGALLVLGGRGESAKLWRIHPPASKLLDSLSVPNATGGAGAPLGDRVYLAVPKHALVAVLTRTLKLGRRISFDHEIVSIETTPSGDRFYVVTDSENTVYVIDRYQDKIATRIALPGRPRDLRVDPYGRYVLVRNRGGPVTSHSSHRMARSR